MYVYIIYKLLIIINDVFKYVFVILMPFNQRVDLVLIRFKSVEDIFGRFSVILNEA